MPISHKFINVPPNPAGINWDPRFQTHNAILDVTPYEPEVIIIGTFNHGWGWNDADFFYGRGMYMWTIMANFFIHNNNVLIASRNPPPGNNIPTLNQIFEICEKGKLCFADVVLGTNQAIPTAINVQNQSVMVNGAYLWNSYKDGQLNQMGLNGWLDDNVDNIIKFIKRTPSIKHIYFTFANGGAWLLGLKNAINTAFPNLQVGSIFTPTGMGFGHNYPVPFNERAWSIAHHWVWNNAGHPFLPVNNPNYIHLDHAWLQRNGVTPMNF